MSSTTYSTIYRIYSLVHGQMVLNRPTPDHLDLWFCWVAKSAGDCATCTRSTLQIAQHLSIRWSELQVSWVGLVCAGRQSWCILFPALSLLTALWNPGDMLMTSAKEWLTLWLAVCILGWKADDQPRWPKCRREVTSNRSLKLCQSCCSPLEAETFCSYST